VKAGTVQQQDLSPQQLHYHSPHLLPEARQAQAHCCCQTLLLLPFELLLLLLLVEVTVGVLPRQSRSVRPL
jgi:hypothetical protein